MTSTSTHIDPETAAHVLWHYGASGGHEPGRFTGQLIAAIVAADMENTARLANVFPDYVAAVLLAKYDEAGVATLQRIAKEETTDA